MRLAIVLGVELEPLGSDRHAERSGRASDNMEVRGEHVCGLGEDSRMCARSRTRYVCCYDSLREPSSRTRRLSVYIRNRTLQQEAAVRRIQEKPLVWLSLLVLHPRTRLLRIPSNVQAVSLAPGCGQEPLRSVG